MLNVCFEKGEMMLSKKQKKLNKKLRHKKTKGFLKKQARKEHNKALKEWALRIKERDKICQVCGTKEGLNAHHLISKEIKEFALDEDNGILLCQKHHFFCKKCSPHEGSFYFHHLLFNAKNNKKRIKRLILKVRKEFEGNIAEQIWENTKRVRCNKCSNWVEDIDIDAGMCDECAKQYAEEQEGRE